MLYVLNTYYYLSDLSEIVTLIENWADWCRVYPIRKTCGSIEKFYRAPSDLEPKPLPIINHCLADILKVERAWRELPEKNKRFIFLYYIKKRSLYRICRVLSISQKENTAEIFHRESVIMLRNRMRRND